MKHVWSLKSTPLTTLPFRPVLLPLEHMQVFLYCKNNTKKMQNLSVESVTTCFDFTFLTKGQHVSGRIFGYLRGRAQRQRRGI